VALQKPTAAFSKEYWATAVPGAYRSSGGSREYIDDPGAVRRRQEGESKTITVPGWDSIIKLGPRDQVAGKDWREYYQAIRENRTPKLSGATVAEIDRLRATREANRTSAQPDWAQTAGGVMTAIDNVQDFASTLATAGRLFLWAGPKVLDTVLPGATKASAELAGRLAARDFAAKLVLELGGRTAVNAAFIDGAAAAIARQVTARALLGFGARIALRAIPVVGWVVLAADILNLMNLLGTVAMPLYALLCRSPQEALAAGLPAAVLKNALCKEIWTLARINPFSRQARAARRVASLGRLPSVSNLIEVVQTTDTLFGWGASFGSLYGAAMETLFSAANDPTFSKTRVNFDVAAVSVGQPYIGRIREMKEAKARALLEAGAVARTAPYVLTKHDLVHEEDHFLTMAALIGAYGELYEFFSDGPREQLFTALADVEHPAPSRASDSVMASLGDVSADEAGIGRWPIQGAPRAAHPDELWPQLARQVGAAVHDFLLPRRNRPEAAFFGAAVNQLADYGWMLATDDADVLRWELTTDTKLLTGLAVDGTLIPTYAPERNVWQFWEAARGLVEDRGGRLILPADVAKLAKQCDVPLVRLLAPDADTPPEWQRWLDSPNGPGRTS
jgi:hypothetical protein